MKRHTITLGASTSTGGKVISASSNGRINGIAIALEGDIASCPICKSQGKIVCIGPRIPELWNGKNVALENDLCICKCISPPTLLPNQFIRYQSCSDNAYSGIQTAKQSPLTELIFDDRYILIDEISGEPLANIEYAVKRANGQIEFGTTDEKGRTHLLTAIANAETIDIYS